MNTVSMDAKIREAEMKGLEMGLNKSALLLVEKCMKDGIDFKDSVEIVAELFGMNGSQLSEKFKQMVIRVNNVN